MRVLIGIISLLFILVSCKKKDPEKEVQITQGSYLLIGNEGNYQLGNGSLSLYNLNDGSLHQKIFENQNQAAIGDIVQSLFEHQGLIYVVVNNSSKIEVLDKDFNRIHTIHGFNSPRYMAFNGNMAFVSELYSQEIHVVDLGIHQITQSISSGTWVEQMTIKDSLLYCSNMESPVMKVFNIYQMAWEYDLNLKTGFDQVVIRGDKAYALCNIDATTLGMIYQIDLIQQIKEDSLSLSFLSSNQLCAGNEGLYFIGDQNIHRLDFDLSNLSLFKNANGQNFYGLDFDINRGLLMVSDVKDYIQQGNVSSFYENGNNVFNFEAGIIPSSFLIFDK